MSGSFYPKSVLGFVRSGEQTFTVMETDRPVVRTMDDKDRTLNFVDLRDTFKFVERKNWIAGDYAKCSCKCTFQDKPCNSFACC